MVRTVRRGPTIQTYQKRAVAFTAPFHAQRVEWPAIKWNRNGTIYALEWMYPVANDLGRRYINGRPTYAR